MQIFKATSIMIVSITLSIASAATAQMTAAGCVVDAAERIDAQDALVAAGVICDDIRAHGVPVDNPTMAGERDRPPEIYRIKLRELGQLKILTVSHENSAGRVLRSERVQLKSLKEVMVIGPRLTKALMTRVPQDKTATVTTLSDEETRVDIKKSGEFFWGLSLEGVVLTKPFISAPGVGLHAVYETSTSALTAKAAFQGNKMDRETRVFNVSVGGRKIFGAADTVLYAGGGVAWSSYYTKTINRDDAYYLYKRDQYKGLGFEGYGEVGVETFRSYDARMLFGARVALPLYMSHYSEYREFTNADGFYKNSEEKEEFYAVPITLSVTLLL